MKKLLVLGAFLVMGYMNVSAQTPAVSKPQPVSAVAPAGVVAVDVADAPASAANENATKKSCTSKTSCSESKEKSSCAGHEKKSCCSSKTKTTTSSTTTVAPKN